MHSMPLRSSAARSPGSLKRATPITRFCGAARLASRASVGPILPPTPSTTMSPGTPASAAVSAGDGVVITSSRCSTLSKRDGSMSGGRKTAVAFCRPLDHADEGIIVTTCDAEPGAVDAENAARRADCRRIARLNVSCSTCAAERPQDAGASAGPTPRRTATCGKTSRRSRSAEVQRVPARRLRQGATPGPAGSCDAGLRR